MEEACRIQSRKRKRKYTQNSKSEKRKDTFKNLVGNSGFLITCDSGREKLARKEISRELLEIILQETEPKHRPEDSETSNNIFLALQSEIKGFQVSQQILTFYDVEVGKGCFLTRVDTSPSIDPVHIVSRLLFGIVKSRKSRTRTCIRILPLQTVCKANYSCVKAAFGELFKKQLSKQVEQSLKFSVRFKSRYNNSLSRQQIIECIGQCASEIAKLCNKKLTVDLKDPDLTILVEVYKSIVGISIVKDMKSVCGFNLRKAT